MIHRTGLLNAYSGRSSRVIAAHEEEGGGGREDGPKRGLESKLRDGGNAGFLGIGVFVRAEHGFLAALEMERLR